MSNTVITPEAQAELSARIEDAQEAILEVEDSPNASGYMKAEAKKKFSTLQRAKGALKSSWIMTRTFLGRLFARVKAFIASAYAWLHGVVATVVGAIVSSLKSLAHFVGQLIARLAGGAVDTFDKAVRVVIPSHEDDESATERESLHALKQQASAA